MRTPKDMDELLSEELGQFGHYQLRTLIMCVVLTFFVGLGSGEFIFSSAKIPARCFIPGCDTDATDFAPPWVSSAVPNISSSGHCKMFPRINSTMDSTCSIDDFNRSTILDCESFVYENTDTIVYDFNLGCDEWRRSFISTARIVSLIVALPLTGYLSDTFGRRLIITINAFNCSWIGLLRYWSTSYWVFVALQAAEAVLGGGTFSCTYVVITEMVGPKYRTICGATLHSFFALGGAAGAVISWAIPNWRLYTLALYTPQLITITYFFLMNESARWLLYNGKFEQAKVILQKMAKANRKSLSEKSYQGVIASAEEEIKKRESQMSVKEPWLPVLVVKSKAVLVTCLVTPVWWITMTLVYYGLAYNSVSISGSRHLNYMAVCLADIPGYWLAMFLMEKTGRKPTLIAAYWICGACLAGFLLMPAGHYMASLLLYLVGKSCIAIVAVTIYIFTAELYPTRYRHQLFSYSCMLGRFGAIIASLTPAIADALFAELPYFLFIGMALLSGLLVFLTPETLNQMLPDTMEDAEKLGKVQTTKM